jgi:hypothetical protein
MALRARRMPRPHGRDDACPSQRFVHGGRVCTGSADDSVHRIQWLDSERSTPTVSRPIAGRPLRFLKVVISWLNQQQTSLPARLRICRCGRTSDCDIGDPAAGRRRGRPLRGCAVDWAAERTATITTRLQTVVDGANEISQELDRVENATSPEEVQALRSRLPAWCHSARNVRRARPLIVLLKPLLVVATVVFLGACCICGR